MQYAIYHNSQGNLTYLNIDDENASSFKDRLTAAKQGLYKNIGNFLIINATCEDDAKEQTKHLNIPEKM